MNKEAAIRKFSNRLEILAELDFEYWKDKNPYFAEDMMHRSMEIGLEIIQERGFLPDFNPRTALDFSNKINESIAAFKEGDNDDSVLAEIFDLIQAWGGKMGRHPYVNSKSRFRFSDWSDIYRAGAQKADNGNWQGALKEWKKIDGIDTFATKHLRFWGEMPPLDTRMRLLLTGKDSLDYCTFITLLEQVRRQTGYSPIDIEAALYAFSQKYFIHKALRFKANADQNAKDYAIAVALAELNN